MDVLIALTIIEEIYILGKKMGRSKISQFYLSILGEEDVLH